MVSVLASTVVGSIASARICSAFRPLALAAQEAPLSVDRYSGTVVEKASPKPASTMLASSGWGASARIVVDSKPTLRSSHSPPLLVVRLLVISALVVTTFVDFDCFEIPDSVSIGGMVVGPMLSFLLPQLHVDSASALLFSGADEVTRTGALLNSLVGMASGFGVLWLVGRVGARAFGKDAMGFGDVKLLGAGGAFVGPGGILAALMLGSVLASLWGAAVMWRFYALVQGRARRRAGRKPVAKAWRVARLAGQYVPFGPFLAAGIGIVLLDWNHVLGLLFRT